MWYCYECELALRRQLVWFVSALTILVQFYIYAHDSASITIRDACLLLTHKTAYCPTRFTEPAWHTVEAFEKNELDSHIDEMCLQWVTSRVET
jgi:hypothetical protein